ncbi:phage major tail tube protein [Cupriavidus sp. UGS-1]|uniref:phage major tail tube protein n=1 Tax=Cupriavidus sp. UGS-1 TaxID=2899826 RepID=UPI001E2CFC75|nr:phage major tail tube protein [Cupriavidus sp. UGS-1]MCD9123996.1 phage major tail tube protein [Cupriavidus sp. UGS-1]
MALPAKLKDLMLFNDGNAYKGEVPEVVLPKLTRKMEEYRAGGMSGPVPIDFGQEAIQMEWTAGGFLLDVMRQYGALKHDAVGLRFAGAYQREDSEKVIAVEIVVRGRHSEVDPGTAKSGEDTEFKVITRASYYKLTVDGEVIQEFDFVNGIERVGGVDLRGAIRQALGI